MKQNHDHIHIIHRLTLTALALLLVAAMALQPHSVQAAPSPQDYTYGECSRADEAAVKAEMTTLAHAVLVEGSSGLQIDTLVASTWRTLGADATFNAAVDAGIARVQSERGYWERLWSGWWADKANEFAKQVAAYAFEDPALKAKLDEISNSIANSLVVELQSAAAQSASSALLCLQSYVGEKYSATLFTAFQSTVSSDVETKLDLANSANIEVSPLGMHTKGLAGIGVIVATQITERIATVLAERFTERLAGNIAERVLGRIGSSFIPYVGWILGAGLVVWDLWEGNEGALPTIREALQGEEVKQQIRAEISQAVADGIAAEVETLSASVATTLVGQWQEFCGNHGVVCQLSGENSTYRALLNNMPVADLTRLVELTDFFWTEFGVDQAKQQVAAALDDGTFAKLLAAPPDADLILATTGSPATTLAWAELAGAQLPQVVQLRLYETIDPARMTGLSLAALLAIEDNSIIHKLRLLPTDQMLSLLQLPTADLTQVVATATPDELGWLAGYLATLSLKQADQVAGDLASGKQSIAGLQSPPPVAVASTAASSSDDAASSVGSDNAQSASSTSESSAITSMMQAEPLVGIAAFLAALWMMGANNGIVVAAVVLLLLCIAVGVALALQRQMTDPPL